MKKEFEKAEVEVTEFDETDVIATSPMVIIVGGEPISGGDNPLDDNE